MKALVPFAALCLLLAADGTPPVAGDWQGTIRFNGVDQHLVVHLKNVENRWNGSLDAIDGGVNGIPIEAIHVAGTRLEFQVPKIQGSYQGLLDSKNGIVSGTWSQGGLKLPLDLRRAVASAGRSGPNRPQEPKPPFSYLTQDVAYDNPQAPGVRLAGTFTKPAGDGPFTTVLLITGSGPQNRDEELMGHKPFLVLADFLTRRGIAVLRVDDRGTGESTGSFENATTQDFAGDAMAGVHYLLGRPDVDKRHIGLIGHSEGGIVAPMVAVKMPEVAFLVLLAATGVAGAEVIEDQVYQASLLVGSSPEVAANNREFEHKVLSAVRNGAVSDEKIIRLAEGNSYLQDRLRAQIPGLRSPWYRYFLAYDPRPALEQVKCPVLALNGSKDSQVSPELNLPAIEAALERGGNRDVTAQIVPGVNHLFQTAKTGAVAEYREIEETMSPKVLETIAAWVKRH